LTHWLEIAGGIDETPRTLGYEGRDRAGNTAARSTTVTVPHDTVQQH